MAPRPSQLTPEIVADDELLAQSTDSLLLTDKRLRRLSRRIIKAQNALLASLNTEQRGAYFTVEEITNERLGESVLTVARAAWRAGRRSR
jgi:hypothetical protein